MSKKKVLVPGGTGAMGVYLIPELLHLGYAVDVVSLDDIKTTRIFVTSRRISRIPPSARSF